MKNPWIKLWRNILNDEKVSFIIRRYGHDCLTFWIGVLTKCEEGILTMDEEIFADLCLLEAKRYEEIRGVFVKRGLLELDGEGRLVVINWAEYQAGESTERVRRFRERQGNTDGTPEKRNETPMKRHETKMERVEGEGDVEGEGEGERASAREIPLPPLEESPEAESEPSPSASPASPPASPEAEAAQAIVRDWYESLNQRVGGKVSSPPRSEDWARAVVRAVDGDLSRARELRAEYFSSWQELWFACTRGTKGLPPEKRAPDFDFRMYCTQAPALLARVAAREAVEADRRFSTAPPPTPEEARPATPEDLAAVERIIEEAVIPPGLAGSLGAAGRRIA